MPRGVYKRKKKKKTASRYGGKKKARSTARKQGRGSRDTLNAEVLISIDQSLRQILKLLACAVSLPVGEGETRDTDTLPTPNPADTESTDEGLSQTPVESSYPETPVTSGTPAPQGDEPDTVPHLDPL